jgi:PAS domain S-box-containing protein
MTAVTEATDSRDDAEHATAALRESDARYRWLFEVATDAMLVADDDARYVDANPQAEILTGYTRDELLQLRVMDLTPDTVPEQGRPLYEEFLQQGRMTGEYQLRRKDGTLVSIEYAAVRTGGQSLSILRDVTARKAAEVERERLLKREREARETAEAAVRARDEFLMVAAHELKTPLTALRGNVQLARRQLDGAVSETPDSAVAATALERARRWLTGADQQAVRLSRLIERLLDVARLETGRLVMERREVDLSDLVRAMTDGARERLALHALRVHLPAAPARVAGDPLRLEQVIEHLLNNAAVYGMPSPTSPIEVEVELPKDAGAGAGRIDAAGVVRLIVQDRGPGVPQAGRPQLFNRLARGDTHTQQAGLGLGLYLSRQIVEAHGGTLDAEFPTEGGTRFVMTLPAA